MNLNRLRTLAGLEPIAEDFTSQEKNFFVYGRCQRKSTKVAADSIITAVEIFSQKPVKQVEGDPSDSSQTNPVKFVDADSCEYLSYELITEDVDLDAITALFEVAAPKEHTLNFKCTDCGNKWTTQAKVNRDDECPKCGVVSPPVKDKISEAEKPNDSSFPKVEINGKAPANTLNMKDVGNVDTMETNKTKQGVDVTQAEKVTVPSNVTSSITKRIKELQSSIETYDEKGYDDKSVKVTAIDVLEKFKEHLAKGSLEEYRMAQVYFGTLMSPLVDMLPTQLINFLHTQK
jgi:predicted RNA-binding Zn-ribbon protein involved in translation (DUF1610 family)